MATVNILTGVAILCYFSRLYPAFWMTTSGVYPPAAKFRITILISLELLVTNSLISTKFLFFCFDIIISTINVFV